MSDFQVGDVVVCVDDSPSEEFPFPGAPWPMRRGWIGRIRKMVIGPGDYPYYLRFADMPDAWVQTRFRKLPKADEQFTQQMRALKPVKVSSNV